MPRPRSEKARSAVLAAMSDVLAEGGYEALSIEGLAIRAGVAKQTIYRWWPSKAAILGEALLELPLLGGAVAVAVSDDLAADLRAWLTAVSAQQESDEGAALARALIAVTATDPPLGARLNERLAGPIVSWIAERLAQAKRVGVVRADLNEGVIADQLLAMASYMSLLGRPMTEDAIARAVEVLMRGISVRETPSDDVDSTIYR